MKKIHILLLMVIVLTLVVGSASAKLIIWVEGIPEQPGEPAPRVTVDVINHFKLGSQSLHNDPDGYKSLLTIDFSHSVTDPSCITIVNAFTAGKNLPQCGITQYDGSEMVREIILNNVQIQKLKEVFDPNDGTGIQYVILVGKSKMKIRNSGDLPETGDTASLLLWAILAVTSCVAFFLLRKSSPGSAKS